jgi:hypothetical protein
MRHYRRLKNEYEYKTLIEVNQQAIHLLYKELGAVDAVRFSGNLLKAMETTHMNGKSSFQINPLLIL